MFFKDSSCPCRSQPPFMVTLFCAIRKRQSEVIVSKQHTKSFSNHDLLLLVVAFLGIFLYGLLAALPGSVLPTLERNQYLPTDSDVGTFLLINAIGAVLAYLVSGPIIDRLGKKSALLLGTTTVIVSMAGFALVVTKLQAATALL